MNLSEMPKNVAGIYMIRNDLNGKVYIGESKDLRHRFKRYYWAVKSDKDYYETKRRIIQEIRNVGINHFSFKILSYGIKYRNTQFRMIKESEYIAKYKSFDPEYGYNGSTGGETGPTKPRPQSPIEKMKRMIPIIVYDTKKNKLILYFGGAKALGDQLGYERTIITKNIKRGSLIDHRYYAFYYDHDKRIEVYDKLKAKKTSKPKDNSLHAIEGNRRMYESFSDYSNIYAIVNDCY